VAIVVGDIVGTREKVVDELALKKRSAKFRAR
jgi:hypothetical protein